MRHMQIHGGVMHSESAWFRSLTFLLLVLVNAWNVCQCGRPYGERGAVSTDTDSQLQPHERQTDARAKLHGEDASASMPHSDSLSQLEEKGIMDTFKKTLAVTASDLQSTTMNAIRKGTQYVLTSGESRFGDEQLVKIYDAARVTIEQRKASMSSMAADAMQAAGQAIKNSVIGGVFGMNTEDSSALGMVAAADKFCKKCPHVEFDLYAPPTSSLPTTMLMPGLMTDLVAGQTNSGLDGLKNFRYRYKPDLNMRGLDRIQAAFIGYDDEAMKEWGKQHEAFMLYLTPPSTMTMAGIRNAVGGAANAVGANQTQAGEYEKMAIVYRDQDKCTISAGTVPGTAKTWYMEKLSDIEQTKCEISMASVDAKSDGGLATNALGALKTVGNLAMAAVGASAAYAPICPGITKGQNRQSLYKITRQVRDTGLSGAARWTVHFGTGVGKIAYFAKVGRFRTIYFWSSEDSLDDVLAECKLGNPNQMNVFNLDVNKGEDVGVLLTVAILVDIDKVYSDILDESTEERNKVKGVGDIITGS